MCISSRNRLEWILGDLALTECKTLLHSLLNDLTAVSQYSERREKRPARRILIQASKGAPGGLFAVTSLFTRLFSYTPRGDREPLENFLTECLCYFLERLTALDRASLDQFVTEVLCGPKIPSALRDRISSARRLRWKTQQSIRCAGKLGYLDISLSADDDLILVVENKVTAEFTTHLIPAAAGEIGGGHEDEICDQLELYEKHLRSRGVSAGLVLLTHRRQAPIWFLTGQGPENANGLVFRHVCRWAEVHGWLARWQLSAASHLAGSSEGAFLVKVAREFSGFLEDRQMSVSELSRDDLNLMKAFYAQDIPKKMDNLLLTVRNSILALPALVTPYGGAQTTFDTTNQIVWDWVYCFERELGWFVCWGIAGAGRYGPRSYDIEFEEPLQAFVVIGSDKRDIAAPYELLQIFENSGWKIHELLGSQKLRVVKAVGPDALLQEGESFNRAFEKWATRTADEGLAILQAAHEEIEKSKCLADSLHPTERTH
jgi:hypothetical protein